MKLNIKEIVKKIWSYPWSKLFWSMFPRPEDTKVRSFFEIAVCVIAFLLCMRLYYVWNRLPVHNDDIDVACLAFNPPDNQEWYPVANIVYRMNMSNVLNKNEKGGIKAFFNENWKIADTNDSIDSKERTAREINDLKILSTLRWKLIKQKNRVLSLRNQHNNYREDSIEYEKIALKAAKEGLYFGNIEEIKRQQDLLKDDCFNRVCRLQNKQNPLMQYFTFPYSNADAIYYVRASSGWSIQNYSDKSIREKCQYVAVDGDTIGAKITKWLMHDNTFIQDFFLIKMSQDRALFTPISFEENPMHQPKITSPFDISQSYFKVRFKPVDIDSIRLTFDFVGATDFSRIDPEPDLITMSSITFSNPEKIEKISKNGLKFHAHFKELENVQSFRLFGLAALFSALIAMFIANFILAIAKWMIKQHHK